MTRKKKTRKIGPVGVRSTPKEERKKEAPVSTKKPQKNKGLPPGSRFSVKLGSQGAGQQAGAEAKDPRHGSKKPVALIMPGDNDAKQKANMAPAEELAMLENDERLQDFLTALDDGEELHADDQAWVDQQLARFQQLVEMLGLELDDDEDDIS